MSFGKLYPHNIISVGNNIAIQIGAIPINSLCLIMIIFMTAKYTCTKPVCVKQKVILNNKALNARAYQTTVPINSNPNQIP